MCFSNIDRLFILSLFGVGLNPVRVLEDAHTTDAAGGPTSTPRQPFWALAGRIRPPPYDFSLHQITRE